MKGHGVLLACAEWMLMTHVLLLTGVEFCFVSSLNSAILEIEALSNFAVTEVRKKMFLSDNSRCQAFILGPGLCFLSYLFVCCPPLF